MRKAFSVLVLFAAVAAIARAESPPADRDAIIADLERTQAALADATRGLTPEQWAFKPAPDRWSVAEAYEHVTLGEEALFGLIQEGLEAPAAPEKEGAAASGEKDAGVQAMVTDRSQRFQAPDFLQPIGRWSLEELQAEFAARRAKTIGFVRDTDADLRAHFIAGPAGELDAAQWFLFLSGHTERHTAQILEVKGDPGFPKE